MSSDSDVAVLKVQIARQAKEIEDLKESIKVMQKNETNKLRAAATFLGTMVLSLLGIIFLVATGFDPTGQNKP